MLLTVYAAWFQIGRVVVQRGSANTAMPVRAAGQDERQVLPVPGVSGGGSAQDAPLASQMAASPALQHSALLLQRHRPWSQAPLTQSASPLHVWPG